MEWLPPVPDEFQWRLPPGRNRTPLNGVTIRPLPADTLVLLDDGAELTSARIESRLANLPVYDL